MRDDFYTAGDVVSIRFGGVLRHYGVVTGRGTVICNSRLHGGVVEQSLDAFSAGRDVRLHGRYSDLDGYHVEQRARRHLGKDYDLFGSNCGHFVRHAHRRKPTPMQVAAATVRTVGDMFGGPKRRW
nr:lecithin retinol acyltransferase family protein [uncultured Hyphomonas sp.]